MNKKEKKRKEKKRKAKKNKEKKNKMKITTSVKILFSSHNN